MEQLVCPNGHAPLFAALHAVKSRPYSNENPKSTLSVLSHRAPPPDAPLDTTAVREYAPVRAATAQRIVILATTCDSSPSVSAHTLRVQEVAPIVQALLLSRMHVLAP
jgi:hypothetical protein